MERTFSIGEALRFGWKTTTDNLWFFLGLMAIVAAIDWVLPSITGGNIFPRPEGLSDLTANLASLPFSIFFWVLSVIASMGMIGISLSFVDGQRPPLAKLFSYYKLFFNYVFASAIYGLIVFAGLILLIVPGIIWAIKFQFYSYAIVDKGLGPTDAIKESSKVTDGVKMKLFLFGLATVGVNFLGVLALGVGLLLTIPTTMLAAAYVYRKLSAPKP